MLPEEIKKPIPTETTTQTKTATVPQERVAIDFRPQVTPYEYQDGQSIMDILSQAKSHKETLADKEKRSAKMAKFAGWSNFISALSNLAGGGYTSTRHQVNPMLSKSLEDLGNSQEEKTRADLYYQELLRKTRAEDYNNGLKNHLAVQKQVNDLGFKTAQFDAERRGKAADNMYNAGIKTVTEKNISPEQQALNERAIKARETSANASMINATEVKADKKNAGEKPFLQIKKGGVVKSMGISQAQQVINDVATMYPNIKNRPDNELSESEKMVKADMSNIERAMGSGNVEATNNLIRAISLRYLTADKEGKWDSYYIQENAATKGSFLPPKQGQTQTKKSLLD